jgi:hypothetical protein
MPPTTASANVYLQGNSDTIQAFTDEQSAISPTGRRELAIVHGVTAFFIKIFQAHQISRS